MKPSIHIVTIPVKDLSLSKKFYTSIFKLAEDNVSSAEDHVGLFLENDLSLVLFEYQAFAKLTNQKVEEISSSVILTHKVNSRQEVDNILSETENLGGFISQKGTLDEYSYSGYIKDLDNHLWEIISWNER